MAAAQHNRYSFWNTGAYFVPNAQVAQRVIDYIENTETYHAFDRQLKQQGGQAVNPRNTVQTEPLVKYLYYPALYYCDDRGVSHLNNGFTGRIENYEYVGRRAAQVPQPLAPAAVGPGEADQIVEQLWTLAQQRGCTELPVLMDGEQVTGIRIIPNFLQNVLNTDPVQLHNHLTANVPVAVNGQPLVRGNLVRVNGDHIELQTRGNAIARDKIWFQTDPLTSCRRSIVATQRAAKRRRRRPERRRQCGSHAVSKMR